MSKFYTVKYLTWEKEGQQEIVVQGKNRQDAEYEARLVAGSAIRIISIKKLPLYY